MHPQAFCYSFDMFGSIPMESSLYSLCSRAYADSTAKQTCSPSWKHSVRLNAVCWSGQIGMQRPESLFTAVELAGSHILHDKGFDDKVWRE